MDKHIVGLYTDEEIMLTAVKKIRAKGLEITEALTPFPVHGLDEALGMKDSRLHTVGFVAGATGLVLMLIFMTWISITDYPTIFGGKPYFSLPSYIPILFEVTVLSASVTMVIAYFARCGLKISGTTRIFDERITDYMFALTFEVTKETTFEEISEIKAALEETGVAEINEKDFDAEK